MDLIAVLRSFLRVAETGSFSAVAAERGVTQPAISRHITALEERLGTRLVHRTTQSVTLTVEGQQLLPSARGLVDEADTLLQLAGRRDKPAGVVRIAASVAFGVYVGKHIYRLLDQHEELSVDIVLRDRYANLVEGNIVEEGLDAEVRVGEVSDRSLISRRIGATTSVIVAAPEYLARHPAPEHPRDLAQHNCIVHRCERDDAVWWFKDPRATGQDEIAISVAGRFSSDNASAVHRAALAGHGIASLSMILAREDIEAGRLVRLLAHYPRRQHAVYIDYPSRRNMPLRVKVVIDFLVLLVKELQMSEEGGAAP